MVHAAATTGRHDETRRPAMRRRWVVRDVMTKDVVFVGPDTGYKELVQVMLRNAVSALPVIDAGGQVIGIVSEMDLMCKVEFAVTEAPTRHRLERRQQRLTRAKSEADTAAELMTSPVKTISDNATVAAAAVMMHREGVKRLPVVDASGVLLGIVSRADVLRGYLRPDAEIRWEVAEEVLRRGMWLMPEQVQVTVNQGIVTLTGHVERSSLAHITIQLVRATAGVVDVVDKLTFRADDTVDPRGVRVG
jgi:CBS domain-containing protein